MSIDDNAVIKSAAWYTASNLLVRASGFITIPIFTRLLTQAEYGQYNNFLSWVSVIGIITSVSLESTLISAKYDYEESFDDYAFSITIISLVMAMFWWIVAGLCIPLLSSLLSMDPVFINGMFVYLLFQPVVNIFQTLERFKFKWKATVASSMVVSIGAAALSVILVITLSNKLFGVIVGRVIPMIFVGIGLMLIYIKEKRRFILNSIAYALPIAAPFIPHLLAMNLLGALNKIFIEQICGSKENGLYSLANNCGLIVSIFTTSLNAAFSPWLGERLAIEDYESTRNMSKPYLITFVLLAIGASLVAPEIMLILGGEQYIEAAQLIPAISMGCIFQFAYCMYVNIEQFKKKTVGMALGSLSAAGLNALLDLLLLPRFGYQVAAIATAVSYGWLFTVHMLLVRRLGLLCVYNTRFNIKVLAITVALMLVISQIYEYRILRFICIPIVLIVLIRMLKQLNLVRSES